MKKILLILAFSIFTFSTINAQDLLDLLGDEEETTEFVNASFKTTRVINAQSLENVAGGVLDFKISHRFGRLNQGAYQLWGLDNASMRMGLDYGINDWFMVGAGRSTVGKTYDAFFKAKVLRQSTGKKVMPLSVLVYGGLTNKTLRRSEEEDEILDFKHQMAYTAQVIIGSKLSKNTSIEIIPTIVHRNLTVRNAEKNTVLSVGIAGRQKLTKRIAINAEYFYVLPNQVQEEVLGPDDEVLIPGITNALSIGFDIETGGHVFQLHFTNANAMHDNGFITETTGDWLDGDIFFGFNISRVFTVKK